MLSPSLLSAIDCTVEFADNPVTNLATYFATFLRLCSTLSVPNTHACAPTTMKEKSNHAQFVVCPWKCGNWSERFGIAEWRMREQSPHSRHVWKVFTASSVIQFIAFLGPKPATLLRLRLWLSALRVCTDDRFIGLMTSRWRKCVPHVYVCVCLMSARDV